ncbi:unnamed protein product, partial [Symbiodinium necroappetens]
MALAAFRQVDRWAKALEECRGDLQGQPGHSSGLVGSHAQVQGDAKKVEGFLAKDASRQTAEAKEAEAQVEAGGIDGLTYASLRGLPSKAYDELATVFNESEACQTVPIHWQQHQVCMLPKKPTIERPISLTSITYRLWCFVRRGPVQKWIRETQAWDKATPGNTCLQIAVHRLLKGEVSRTAGKHMIAILIDLETFYDCVDLQLLAKRLCEADFPPVIGALALQTYAGERHIVSEDVLSEGIWPQKGIPAGCPMATTMARVFLAPILQDVSSTAGLAGLDTWVDDIGADYEAQTPQLVARQAIAGYRFGKGRQRQGQLKKLRADRVCDPWATVVVQQVQEWFTVLSRWGPDQAPLDRAWQQTVAGFQEGRTNWHHVKGPLAATVGHMTGLKWNFPSLQEWRRPEPPTSYDLTVGSGRAKVLQDITDDISAERSRRTAESFACPEISNGIDWFVGR